MSSSILLVDDELWVRTALRKVIERSGQPCRVVKECSNGAEAMEWLADHHADVVMTDVKMPVMDGIALVKSLREREKTPEVIMISGYDDFPYLQFALRAQVADYLLKPVEADDMSRCLQTILNRLQGSRGAALPAAAEAMEKEPESPIRQALRYIHSTLPGDVSLQEVAAHVHLNPCYLSQLFKQQMKINFIDYVLQQRMERAQELLSRTSLRISEIAEKVGYADLSNFSSAYKRFTGMTPTEYRKNRISEDA